MYTQSPIVIVLGVTVRCPSRWLCWRLIMKCCVWPSCPGAAAAPREPNQTHLQSGAEASAGAQDCRLTCEVPPGTAWGVDVQTTSSSDSFSCVFFTSICTCTNYIVPCAADLLIVEVVAYTHTNTLISWRALTGGTWRTSCYFQLLLACIYLIIYSKAKWVTACLVKTELRPESDPFEICCNKSHKMYICENSFLNYS